MSKIFSRQFAPFWFFLMGALALAGVFGNLSYNSRISNLDLRNDGIKDSYIMTSKSQKNVCALVDRRDATIRRSRTKIPGQNWSINIAPGNPGEPREVLISSRQKGAILFIPVDDTTNLAYPYIHEFVRKNNKQLDMPKLEWTQLYFNRIYSGLYLKIKFPSDPTAGKGRKGLRREFLSARGEELTLTDTAFNPRSRLLAQTLLEGVFPMPEAPPQDVAWLSEFSRAGRTTYLLYNENEKYRLTLMPLPIAIDDAFYKIHGKALSPFIDERFAGWVRMTEPDYYKPPFSDKEKQQLRDGFGKYKKDFEKALKAHRKAFRGNLATRPERPVELPFGDN